MADEYVVSVKPSARQRSRQAGEWVASHGSTRSFPSKALARQWAREQSGPGRHVWVQDADPNDADDVDGYLVAGRRPSGSDDPDGEQVGLAPYAHDS